MTRMKAVRRAESRQVPGRGWRVLQICVFCRTLVDSKCRFRSSPSIPLDAALHQLVRFAGIIFHCAVETQSCIQVFLESAFRLVVTAILPGWLPYVLLFIQDLLRFLVYLHVVLRQR